jgi:hypothetical protein
LCKLNSRAVKARANRNLTLRSSGQPPEYRCLPLNSNVGRFKSRIQPPRSRSCEFEFAACGSCRRSYPKVCATSNRRRSRQFAEFPRLASAAVPGCAVHVQSGSGQGWRRLPVRRRSAHRCAILKQSKAKAVAVCRCRGASVANLNPTLGLRACAGFVHTRRREEKTTPAAVSRTAAPRSSAR